MISGISRLSIRQVFLYPQHLVNLIKRIRRSITATATFFTTGVITAHMLHGELPAMGQLDWTIGKHGKTLLVFQAVPLAILSLLYFLVCHLKLALIHQYLTALFSPRNSQRQS